VDALELDGLRPYTYVNMYSLSYVQCVSGNSDNVLCNSNTCTCCSRVVKVI